MKSSPLGTNTSPIEVTHVDTQGIWVFVLDTEYFLAHEDYPWFTNAKLADILNVQLHHGVHLHWPALDVDLSLESLRHPQKYPLIAQD